MSHNPTDGKHPISAETYYDSWTEGSTVDYNGLSYSGDLFKFGFVSGDNTYDKDVNNYNFAQIEEKLVDFIYPVGSIYITTSSANFSNYLGKNWVRFARGKCLFGIYGDTTGDNPSDTTPEITAAGGGHAGAWQHSHEIIDFGHTHDLDGSPSGAATIEDNGEHQHVPANTSYKFIVGESDVNWKSTRKRSYTNTNNDGISYMYSDTDSSTILEQYYTNESGSHSHSMTGTTEFDTTGIEIKNSPTTSTNTDASIANLPPYIGVYMWKRIADS